MANVVAIAEDKVYSFGVRKIIYRRWATKWGLEADFVKAASSFWVISHLNTLLWYRSGHNLTSWEQDLPGDFQFFILKRFKRYLYPFNESTSPASVILSRVSTDVILNCSIWHFGGGECHAKFCEIDRSTVITKEQYFETIFQATYFFF